VSIVSFKNQGTEDVFNGDDTKAARKTCPVNLLRVARRKLDQVDNVITLADLRVPPGNRLEALKEDRAGQHAIRINDQFRVCFVWTDAGPAEVEIIDYHGG
jgi:proteic killer suppression protein